MPVFQITYTDRHNESNTIELVTESHWDHERTAEYFRSCHPDATEVLVHEAPEFPGR